MIGKSPAAITLSLRPSVPEQGISFHPSTILFLLLDLVEEALLARIP
jgi:hypothetical protein